MGNMVSSRQTQATELGIYRPRRKSDSTHDKTLIMRKTDFQKVTKIHDM